MNYWLAITGMPFNLHQLRNNIPIHYDKEAYTRPA